VKRTAAEKRFHRGPAALSGLEIYHHSPLRTPPEDTAGTTKGDARVHGGISGLPFTKQQLNLPAGRI
jgi:hypothetical protein